MIFNWFIINWYWITQLIIKNHIINWWIPKDSIAAIVACLYIMIKIMNKMLKNYQELRLIQNFNNVIVVVKNNCKAVKGNKADEN